MGGNSTKATSGINGAGTQTQQELGIPDNAKTFFDDTKKSVRVVLNTGAYSRLIVCYPFRRATLRAMTSSEY
jgi:succinate dehydrogenase/fumarate reductase flavoprotein subunit